MRLANRSFQSDGNLVLYDAGQHSLWESGTNEYTGQVELVVQDNLNVVLYLYDASGKRNIWSTKTFKGECPDSGMWSFINLIQFNSIRLFVFS